ncbi:MAG: esterase/lipase family protein [Aureliella sp.]
MPIQQSRESLCCHHIFTKAVHFWDGMKYFGVADCSDRVELAGSSPARVSDTADLVGKGTVSISSPLQARWYFVIWIAVGWISQSASAQDPPFLRLPTLGGPIYWTDLVVHGDWRVQRNEVTGHYRLLDSVERVVLRGSCIDDCYQELQTRIRCGQLAPMPKHVVIVMHGLAGSRRLMGGMARYLENEGEYTVLNVGFASTLGTIQQQTLALESVLRNLCGVECVSFVCHSQSNIMVRHLLYRMQHQRYPPPIRFNRMVMISPPNHGTNMADTVGQRAFFQWSLGEVVDQFALTKGWPCLEPQLETPWFEFGIIAGGKCDEDGYLELLPGDDDGIVPIRSHYLEGAADFTQLGGLHQIMPTFRRTQEAALRFLKQGRF